MPTIPQPTYSTQSISLLANRPTMRVTSQHGPLYRYLEENLTSQRSYKKQAACPSRESAKGQMGRVLQVKEEFVDLGMENHQEILEFLSSKGRSKT